MAEQPNLVRAFRGWIRRHLRVLITVALVAIGGLGTIYGWAVASPSGASPDEDFHLGSIWCPTPVDQSCEVKTLDDGTLVALVPSEVASSVSCFSFLSDQSAACVDDLPATMAWTARFDHLGLYPGGYYDLMHLFAGGDVFGSVVLMRCFNGLLALGLLGALAALVPQPRRRLMVYAMLPVSVPMLVFLIASINPSSWAITGVAVAWFGMCAAAVADQRWRMVVASAIALVGAAMGATARTDAGAYLMLAAVAAVVLLFSTYIKKPIRFVLPGAIMGAGVVGYLSGGGQAVLTSGMTGAAQAGSTSLLLNNFLHLPRMLVDYSASWFSLNWLDTPMPPLVWVPVLAVSLGVLFVGIARMSIGKGLALGGVTLVYAFLPLWVLQQSNAAAGTEVQPRYFLPLVPIIFYLALWRPRIGGAPRLSLSQTIFAYLGLVGAHSVALHFQIRRFVTGYDVGALNLNYKVEWWHGVFSPMVTWALGTLGFAMLAGLLFMVRKDDELVPDETAPIPGAAKPGPGAAKPGPDAAKPVSDAATPVSDATEPAPSPEAVGGPASA